MSEPISYNCILAAALVVFSFVSNAQAAPHLAFQQFADGQPPGADIPAASVENNPNPGLNTSNPEADSAAGKVPSIADTSGELDCGSLENAAAAQGLPIDFFTRLIQQESNFNPKAVSRAGAQGIAQFMPGTARWRGLSNPFEPAEALKASARWLRELRDQFGNLGLAAAAYNAGPQRVKNWLAGRGKLPNETRAYVRIVTGSRAEEWMSASKEMLLDPPTGPCALVAKRAPPAVEDHEPPTAENHIVNVNVNVALAPWGVQLIGDSSEIRALSAYADLQKRYHSVLSNRAPTVVKRAMGGHGPSTWYFVRVAQPTREGAMQLCSKLQSVGGSCIVSRN